MFVSHVINSVMSLSPSLCLITLLAPPSPSLQPKERLAVVGRTGQLVCLEPRFPRHRLLLSPSTMLFHAFPNSGEETPSTPGLPGRMSSPQVLGAWWNWAPNPPSLCELGRGALPVGTSIFHTVLELEQELNVVVVIIIILRHNPTDLSPALLRTFCVCMQSGPHPTSPS